MAKYSEPAAIMAIGDSLYQGVRSLSIAADKARHSVPAMVAAALGLPMSLPLMPRPILFDLEVILGQGALVHLIEAIRQVALKNLDAWLKDPVWSTEEAFDNLALGGAAITNLSADSFDAYWPTIPGLRDELAANHGSITDVVTVIGKLWYALNACFVLNPSRRSGTAQSAASPIAQVAARKPATLLVNIGSNEGLFDAGFTGSYDTAAKASIAGIPDKMAALAGDLAAAAPADCRIVINSLLRPRFIPNLYPRTDPDTFPGPDYYPSYIAYLGGADSIPAAALQAFDDQIAGVNAASKERMQAVLGARMVWVDVYDACDRFDGKHYADRFVEIPSAGIRLRNQPLEIIFGHFNRGGISGLDNMHPTVPGYAKLAEVVLAGMGSPQTLSIDDAYAADTLLQDLPPSYPLFQLEIALLGSLGLFKGI